jgi:hypothetical protein
MGNSQSNAETGGKYIGGWLGLTVGCVVSSIFPPLAPVALTLGTSTFLYGTGSTIRTFTESQKPEGTKSDFISGMADGIFLGGNLKAGVDYKDNDTNPNFHICGSNINPIEIREQKEIKEKTYKNIVLENNYIKYNTQYYTEYINFIQTYPKGLKVNNINTKLFNTNKFITYEFINYNITPKEIIKNFELNLKYYNDDPLIDRIYVARRKLDSLPIYFGWAAHSALLMKTKNEKWFVCEYGCENNKNKVSLYEVKNINRDYFITNNGRKYNKQIVGSSLEGNVSVGSVRELMENKMNKHSYWMLFWNCHIAQEITREELGLKVKDKYLDDKYREEWDIFIKNRD